MTGHALTVGWHRWHDGITGGVHGRWNVDCRRRPSPGIIESGAREKPDPSRGDDTSNYLWWHTGIVAT